MKTAEVDKVLYVRSEAFDGEVVRQKLREAIDTLLREVSRFKVD